MSCTEFARIRIKKGNGLPTIPVSTDHRNGDWIDTDIYVGEMYMDKNTGLIYTRTPSDVIIQSTTSASDGEVLYKARLVQSGTNAPVVTEYVNNTGLTITPGYAAVGSYSLAGFAGSGLLEGNIEIEMSQGMTDSDNVGLAVDPSNSAIIINAYDSDGVQKNGVLKGGGTGSTQRYNVITLKKYP